MTKRTEIKVTGLVQGVGFRYYTQDKAQSLNISGYVRNDPDGSVKIVAEGEEDNLKELASWCYNGVRWARVEEVKVDWLEPTGEFKEFEIRF